MLTLYESLTKFANHIGFTETTDELVIGYMKTLPEKQIDEADVIRVVSNEYKIEPERLKIHAHPRPVAEPRMLCMYLINKVIGYGLAKTGEIFARDHSTVLHGCRTVQAMVNNNREFRQRFIRISHELGIGGIEINNLITAGQPPKQPRQQPPK